VRLLPPNSTVKLVQIHAPNEPNASIESNSKKSRKHRPQQLDAGTLRL